MGACHAVTKAGIQQQLQGWLRTKLTGSDRVRWSPCSSGATKATTSTGSNFTEKRTSGEPHPWDGIGNGTWQHPTLHPCWEPTERLLPQL